MKWQHFPVGLFLVLVLVCAGCIFSPDDTNDNNTPPPVNPYVFPDTRDKLMNNFKEAYSRLDIDEYRNVLHTNYTFIFSSYDVDLGEIPTDPLNRDTELAISERIFSQEPFDGGNGTIQPGVSEIQFERLDRTEAWDSLSTRPDIMPGAHRAVFNIDLSIFRPGASGEGVPSTILVNGTQEFWVFKRDSLQSDGSIRPYWQMVGQVDLTTPEPGA